MKKKEVEIGKVYLAKISGKLVPVKVSRESPFGGWGGENLRTSKTVRIHSAQKLRCELEKNPDTGKWRPVKAEPKVVTSCPWCESKSAPVATDLERANFQIQDPRDPKVVTRNPAMCPDCFRVGGWEDWGA